MNRRTLIKAGAALIAAPALIIPKPAKAFNAFVGCILNLIIDDISRNWNASISPTWTAEAIDTDGFHSLVTNQSLIIIPSSMNGRYGIFNTCCVLINGTAGMTAEAIIQQNGTGTISVTGMATVGTTAYCSATTPPQILNTSDSYRVLPVCTDTSTVLQASNSSFSLQVVG